MLYGSSLTLARRQLTLENETTFFLREREREQIPFVNFGE